MSHYEEISTINQTIDVSDHAHRGDADGNYDTVAFTAIGHINREAQSPDGPRVPPLPQGGHLHPYSTLFTDANPTDVVNALASYFGSQGIDFVMEDDFTLRCYPCFGQTQVPIEICTFTNIPSERSKGAFAFEFRNQSLDSVNFFNVFRSAKDVLVQRALVRHVESRDQVALKTDDAPLTDDDFLPTLNLAAFDMSVLEDETDANQNAFAFEDTAEDLLASFQMLVNITNQEDSSIKTQAIRGIVDVMGKNSQSIAIALDSGAFDVLTMCICEAAQHVADATLQLDAASPQRDMCHHAVSGIANACEISNDARLATIRSGALPALVLFVSSLADTYAVHCRELVRESLRAYMHIVSSMDNTLLAGFLEQPLDEHRSCGSCISDMITALQFHLDTRSQDDHYLGERISAIKRQLLSLNASD